MKLVKGQFVQLDGLPAVVVGVPGDSDVPDDHVALWFGHEGAVRRSDGGTGGIVPRVWTVPIDACESGIPPEFNH